MSTWNTGTTGNSIRGEALTVVKRCNAFADSLVEGQNNDHAGHREARLVARFAQLVAEEFAREFGPDNLTLDVIAQGFGNGRFEVQFGRWGTSGRVDEGDIADVIREGEGVPEFAGTPSEPGVPVSAEAPAVV